MHYNFLRTNHLELAQQSTKDAAGQGGPSETYSGKRGVNSKGWHGGCSVGGNVCLGFFGEQEREGFFLWLVLCSTVGWREELLFCYVAFSQLKFLLRKALGFFPLAQEHWVGALLRSGPPVAQCGFSQVQHEAWCIFFQLHPAFHPLSAHGPLHCVSLMIHNWAVCASRPWEMSLWHAGFILSLPASPSPEWARVTLHSSRVSNAPAPGNHRDTWDR